MKTIAVVVMAVLSALSCSVRANAFVSFGTEVLVEHTFSPDALNLTVSSGTVNKGNTVVLGRHNDYLRAMKDKYIVTGNTSNKAVIVAFFRDEKISLEDAFALLNNYNVYDNANPALVKDQDKRFHYSIEILSTQAQNLQAYLKVCPELEKMIAQKDESIFLMGHIASFSQAVAIQEKLSKAGLRHHVIVAYEGNKQVPVYRLAKAE